MATKKISDLEIGEITPTMELLGIDTVDEQMKTLRFAIGEELQSLRDRVAALENKLGETDASSSGNSTVNDPDKDNITTADENTGTITAP